MDVGWQDKPWVAKQFDNGSQILRPRFTLMDSPLLLARRSFLARTGVAAWLSSIAPGLVRETFGAAPETGAWIEPALAADWLAKWRTEIMGEVKSRYCDREEGEELGWLVSHVTSGFYYGYLATRDSQWVGLLFDWTEAVITRAVKEPDGYIGWPKGNGGGGDSKEFKADSLLGEAMFLKPAVLMAKEVLANPDLNSKYGDRATHCLAVAKDIFKKWDSRDCWRAMGDGGLWVVPDWGVDLQSPGRWSAGYESRKTGGFSNPANKQNEISMWLLAMFDATGDKIYHDRAEQWFRLLKKRMRTVDDGKRVVWNYWDPAGPWDYRPDGQPKHWVGVHPNGGYYWIDVSAITEAFEHGVVFTRRDIDMLIATNRDYMWNRVEHGAQFKRIDGGEVDLRWKNSPGVLWSSLTPYDAVLRRIFVANHKPASWGGVVETVWFLSHARH